MIWKKILMMLKKKVLDKKDKKKDKKEKKDKKKEKKGKGKKDKKDKKGKKDKKKEKKDKKKEKKDLVEKKEETPTSEAPTTDSVKKDLQIEKIEPDVKDKWNVKDFGELEMNCMKECYRMLLKEREKGDNVYLCRILCVSVRDKDWTE